MLWQNQEESIQEVSDFLAFLKINYKKLLNKTVCMMYVYFYHTQNANLHRFLPKCQTK